MSAEVTTEKPLEIPADKLGDAGAAAARDALRGWARAADGFPSRFREDAFTRLGLTKRSARYQERQRVRIGAVIPWKAPLPTGLRFPAVALTEGTGHTIAATSTATVGEAILRAKSPLRLRVMRYLSEWAAVHPVEESEIMQRLERAMGTRMQEALA